MLRMNKARCASHRSWCKGLFCWMDRSRSCDLGGTGLGLSIAKHLMIAKGVRMEIESQLDRGTKLSLYFPLHYDNSE